MEKANKRRSKPLSFANNSVLNPTKRHKAKTTSATVAMMANVEINDAGNQGLIIWV